jgi:hypothetical protein
MPVYDPPAPYLRAAIASVRAQVYPNWELCAVDDASTAAHVGGILEEAGRRSNQDHPAESNRGSAVPRTPLARHGEFVAGGPRRHLAPECLYEAARRLQAEPDPLQHRPRHEDVEGRRMGAFFKPTGLPTSSSR